MKKHGLKTYIRVCCDPPTDELYAALCAFGCKWERSPHDLKAMENRDYDVDVNKMIRKTIAPFVGRESELKSILTRFRASAYLVIVPELYAGISQVTPILSLDGDIVKFLYLSGVDEDLDLYLFK